MPSDAPFFIVGSSRSGTTLLRLILTGHSRLHIPPETWFLLDVVERLPLTAPLTPAQIAQAVDVIVREPRWPDLHVPDAEFRAAAMALHAPGLAEVVALPFQAVLRRHGKTRFGDKTPPYIRIVPQLATLFPGARFIHLIRDGRDVAISFIDAQFRGRAYHGRNFEWSRAVRCGRAWQGSPLAAQIMDVRYEDLVRDPESTVRAICRFLGETFEPAMLRFEERADAIPERERRIHGNLAAPVSAAAAGAWWRRLSPLECFLLESSLWRELRQLGYSLRFGAPVWRPLLWSCGVVLNRFGAVAERAMWRVQRALSPTQDGQRGRPWLYF